MNERLEKTFLNSKLLVFSGVVAALLYLAAQIPYVFLKGYEWYRFDFLIQLVQAIAIFGLIWAYKKGETNVQKALVSGLLFNSFVSTFENTVFLFDDMMVGYYDFYSTFLMVIFTLCTAAILLSHIFMQTEHKGNDIYVEVITVAVIIGLVTNIVDAFLFLKNGVDINALYLLNNLGEDFFLIMILCVESRIQAYKRIRTKAMENNEWTEEAKAEAKKIFLA